MLKQKLPSLPEIVKRKGSVVAAFYQRPSMLCSMFTRLRSCSCTTLMWNNSSLILSHPPTSLSWF